MRYSDKFTNGANFVVHIYFIFSPTPFFLLSLSDQIRLFLGGKVQIYYCPFCTLLLIKQQSDNEYQQVVPKVGG